MGLNYPGKGELAYQLEKIRESDMHKLEKVAYTIYATIGSITKLFGFNYKYASRGSQYGIFTICTTTVEGSQYSLLWARAKKVLENQSQVLGVQGAEEVLGDQKQFFGGIQGAGEVGEDQKQLLGVQWAEEVGGDQDQIIGYTLTPEKIKKIKEGFKKVKNYLDRFFKKDFLNR